MRAQFLLSALPILGAQGARILQANDDGWAELYIRSLNEALNEAGHDVVLSAPADNQSGTGSSDKEPSPRSDACEYDSCAANSGPVGSNSTNTRLNWVNSYPATSTRYGIDTFGPQIWNGEGPELVVTGPNVGTNLFLAVPFSGTIGAAVYASHTAGIPAIAFSGASTGNLAWNTSPVPARSAVYALLATQLTEAVLASGTPYLPSEVFLNVNFPEITDDCNGPANFKWVLSRINPGTFSDPDTESCGSTRLPTETSVIDAGGCHISVSVGDATDKTTAPAEKQAVVLQKLGSLLTCLE
ncbi:sure-like protein [Hypoxylon trugodes]|uniref:sure-like protein n=1 Tax=Hypoxylon trugodes TaxID=326681 RepID=UPI002196FBA2|nr:sure-like protein [Hypoxylon trugodes]KAI1388367.1 sure-like protein [Hypoxylon trugodes]